MEAELNHPQIGKHPHDRHLRLLSYNIQAGFGSSRYRHYLTQSWKQLLPAPSSRENLDRIAGVISQYDLVALQETDAGSFRSDFINQSKYLSEHSHLTHWYQQINRRMGRFGQFSNSMLCRYRPDEVREFKLPGLIPGRGAMMVRYGPRQHGLTIFSIHLALGSYTRHKQLAYLSELISAHEHVVLMGDLNCQLDSREMEYLFRHTHLLVPEEEVETFPSWQPQRRIDHILVSPSVNVETAKVLEYPYSDHLPVAMQIAIPHGIHVHY